MGLQVAVAGGGIIGMSIAWRLAQAGASVTVFDAGRVGNEASWADAWTGFALESLASYPAFVAELDHASGVSIDFRICGAFEFAFEEEEADALRRRAERQSAIRIYSEQFHPGRVPGVRPGALAAQYYPSDAVVNPRDVMRALEVACRRGGVRLREFEPLHRLGEDSGFDATVLAAGAWSSQVHVRAGGATVPIPESIPVRGHLIAFEEHSGLCDSIVRHGQTYLLRRSGDLIVAGTSTERVGYARSLDGAVAAQIACRAGRLVPALEGRGYMVWNGFRPDSAAGHPVIGRVEGTSVWLAYGHYRNGILLAPATASRVVSEIMQASSKTDSSFPAAPQQ
jgi:glycine oxidase